MTIEAVIARSRLPGGFTTHKRFTIARERAIEKLRKFALAEPHDYVLEFVQAAVASGATSIAIAIDDDSCSLSWIGGGLEESELGQLFDFLFASQDRTDIEHVRGLALGINAALGFRPERVVVESGDGTAAGTSRLVLQPEHDRVEIGRADRPMLGTYVLLDRFRKRDVPRRHEAIRTIHALEFRCLCAPIPILVNGESVFGPSLQRIPALFGYDKVVAFDEGELYGVLGLACTGTVADFRLLTHGVAIQSKQRELVPGKQIGGIVCFDRLRKTVDHAGIVEDERFAEMWLRLRPYAEELVTGVRRTIAGTCVLGGPPLSTPEICELARDGGRLVIVDPDVDHDDAARERAWAIGRALQAAVLCVPPQHHEAVRLLAGNTPVTAVDVRDDDVVAFYTSAVAGDPPRPWLAPPFVPEPWPMQRIADELVADGSAAPLDPLQLLRALGSTQLVTAIHTPVAAAPVWGVEVRIIASERLAHTAMVGSRHVGHVVTVRLGDADFAALRRRSWRGTTLADELAREVVETLDDTLDRATQLALASGPSLAAGSNARRLAWAAILRHTLVRLAHRDAEFVMRFAQTGADALDLLALPLLRTHAGTDIGLAELQDVLARTDGTVAFAPPHAEPSGRDPALVLALDPAEAVFLADVVGDGVLVDLDREPAVDEPVPRLLACARDPVADARDRQRAIVRLQGAAARVLADSLPDPHGLLAAPLFLADDDRPCALADLSDAGLRVDHPPHGLAGVLHALEQPRAPAHASPHTLFTTPAAATLLARRLPVYASSELAFDARRVGPAATPLLAEVAVSEQDVVGRLGVPAIEIVPSILVVSADDRSSAELFEVAATSGVSGVLRLRGGAWDDARAERVIACAHANAERVLAALFDRVRSGALASEGSERAWHVLLAHSARSVSLAWQPDASLVAVPHTSIATTVLRAPILPTRTGRWTTPAALLARWCRAIAAGDPDPAPALVATLADGLPHPLVEWLRAALDPLRVPTRPRPIAPPMPVPRDLSSFASAIATWLFHLRPDRVASVPTVVCIDRFADDDRLVHGIWDRITINELHPLVQGALAQPRDPEAVAWLLLAIYAHVNALRVEVGNAHEREFQARVFEALLAGQLQLT